MLNIKKGFTLIELILVISVGASITFASFQQMLKTYENNQAKAVGQEIKQIGNSVNSYIALHYDKLSTYGITLLLNFQILTNKVN